jgi:hypothetical protein
MSRISCLAAFEEGQADEAEPGLQADEAGVAASLAGVAVRPRFRAAAAGAAGAGSLGARPVSAAARLALRRRQLLSRGCFVRLAELPAALSPAGSSSSGGVGAARFPATRQGRESCGPSDGATPWLSCGPVS